MNNKFLILCFSALLCSSISFAKIWRVNNNGGGGGDFTTVQDANDGVSVDGDTIHIEPSPNSYGNLTASKRLVWLSTGAFLGIHPGEQYSQTAGRIANLIILGTSANSIFSLYVDGNVSVGAANIRLERCYVTGGITVNINVNNSGTNIPSNDVVINCYAYYLYFYTGTNHFATNNIVEDVLYVAPPASAIIQNNVFNAVTTAPSTVANCTLQNNIFNKTIGAYTFTNCVVQYNMSGSGAVLPVGNFNQNNVAMANVFVNNSGTNDAAFVLKAASPAIGSGFAGDNMGAFGGTSPFKIAMQPAIPAIYKISAPFVPTGNTMNVTFSTKSNN